MVISQEEFPALLKNIDNIIFDFGGVLFDIDYENPIREFEKLGITEFDSWYTKKSQSPLFDQLEKGEIGQEEFVTEVKRHLSQKITSEQIIDAWNSILIDIPLDRIQLVKQLKDRFKTFLLSNTNEIHSRAFEEIMDKKFGIKNFVQAFDKICYSHDIGKKKPDSETFLWLCEDQKLNLATTLFLDDSEQHVIGAHEAGLFAFHFIPGHHNLKKLFERVL